MYINYIALQRPRSVYSGNGIKVMEKYKKKKTLWKYYIFFHCHAQLRRLTSVPTNNRYRYQLELSLSNYRTNVKYETEGNENHLQAAQY